MKDNYNRMKKLKDEDLSKAMKELKQVCNFLEKKVSNKWYVSAIKINYLVPTISYFVINFFPSIGKSELKSSTFDDELERLKDSCFNTSSSFMSNSKACKTWRSQNTSNNSWIDSSKSGLESDTDLNVTQKLDYENKHKSSVITGKA